MKKIIKKQISKKAKIILVAVAAVVLCVAAVLSIVLIKSSDHPIDQFANKILKKQNFEMKTILSGDPTLGIFEQVYEVDGNVHHICSSDLTTESYIKIAGDTKYVYKQTNGGKWIWEKSDASSPDGLIDWDMIEQLLNADNYEPVAGEENTYRQKDTVVFEQFQNVKIIIDGDVLAIEMQTLSDDTLWQTLIVFSKIGEVKLQLPAIG